MTNYDPRTKEDILLRDILASTQIDISKIKNDPLNVPKGFIEPLKTATFRRYKKEDDPVIFVEPRK